MLWTKWGGGLNDVSANERVGDIDAVFGQRFLIKVRSRFGWIE